ncbi:SET domain-containing protein [Phaeosphaeriaceae sp. SRC1lsM3a]|nr:SET domain-containing protein [Stagonospora sp. SRC1lsM3a]
MPAMVVIPTSGSSKRRVLGDKVYRILSNRVVGQEEQFLVQWKTDLRTEAPPLSWHPIDELVRCLDPVQDYLDIRAKLIQDDRLTKKRKSPEDSEGHERRPSPFNRQNQQASRSTSVSSDASKTIDVFNGVLDTNEYGLIFCRPHFGSDVSRIDIRTVPTPDMDRVARHSKVDTAMIWIRAEYVRRLKQVQGNKPIHLFNIVDNTTPSLRFKYIPDYVLREGVHRLSMETQQGCQQCSPHMGRSIGCEYTKKCDCLEYAAVDEARITDPEMMAQYKDYLANGGDTIGFPKKFPYFAEGTKIQRTGCLVPFYLKSRHPIYECNEKCNCGPYCRNKNVQFGRTVELEIFKTSTSRGWGLRCKEDLHEGQFIDTYRGEIITDAEATWREKASSKAKASYLYSLDKFQESEGLNDEDIYVVDGEFMGGPTKFLNHSCEPNCRQYTVSYNKHDPRVYDIAFFACRFIKAGEELTFDYLDKEEGDPVEEPGEGAVPCLCGAEKCRKWLWT